MLRYVSLGVWVLVLVAGAGYYSQSPAGQKEAGKPSRLPATKEEPPADLEKFDLGDLDDEVAEGLDVDPTLERPSKDAEKKQPKEPKVQPATEQPYSGGKWGSGEEGRSPPGDQPHQC